MAEVLVSILGRSTVDATFVKRWETTVEVPTGVTVTVTPVIAPTDGDDEMVVEVRAESSSANFAAFGAAPIEAAGGDAGLEPSGPVYCVFPRQTRRAPFRGGHIGLCRTGTPRLSA